MSCGSSSTEINQLLKQLVHKLDSAEMSDAEWHALRGFFTNATELVSQRYALALAEQQQQLCQLTLPTMLASTTTDEADHFIRSGISTTLLGKNPEEADSADEKEECVNDAPDALLDPSSGGHPSEDPLLLLPHPRVSHFEVSPNILVVTEKGSRLQNLSSLIARIYGEEFDNPYEDSQSEIFLASRSTAQNYLSTMNPVAVTPDHLSTNRSARQSLSTLERLFHPQTEAAQRVLELIFSHYLAKRDGGFYSLRRPEVTCNFAELLLEVCARVTEDLDNDPVLLSLTPPLTIMGNIHGNAHTVAFFLKNFINFETMSYTGNKLLFLGDYVDEGEASVEVCALLFAIKCLSPESLFLLRGNHETMEVSGNVSELGNRCLRWQCQQRFGAAIGDRVHRAFCAAFARLPLAAEIDGKIFCTHTGIPRPIKNFTFGDCLRLLRSEDFPRHVDWPELFLKVEGCKVVPTEFNFATTSAATSSTTTTTTTEEEGSSSSCSSSASSSSPKGKGSSNATASSSSSSSSSAASTKSSAAHLSSNIDLSSGQKLTDEELQQVAIVRGLLCSVSVPQSLPATADADALGFAPSVKRGSPVYAWGTQALESFMEQGGYELLIRTCEDAKKQGVVLTHDERIISVFTNCLPTEDESMVGAVYVSMEADHRTLTPEGQPTKRGKIRMLSVMSSVLNATSGHSRC